MNEIITFSLVALLLVISPGPNGVLIIKTVSSGGKDAAFFNIIGLTLATFVHGALSIFGLSALLLQSAELFLMIKVIGAMYLLFIGLKAIFQTFGENSKSSSKNITSRKSSKKTDINMFTFIMEGFLTQILNPKVSMFYLAAFPQFIPFDNVSFVNAFVLVAIHASIIFSWFFCLIMTISKIKFGTNTQLLGKWVQRMSGMVMVYFSGLLLSFKA